MVELFPAAKRMQSPSRLQACFAIGTDFPEQSARKMESGISRMLPPKASALPMRDSFSSQASAASSNPRKDSIATNGWPAAIEESGSLPFLLSGQAAQRFLGLSNILHSQPA